MADTREKPRTAPSREELQRTIPGWGVNSIRRMAVVPKEVFAETGAPGFPERQPELFPRERSTEHKFLTPVFGTAQPLRGLSGAIAATPTRQRGANRSLAAAACRRSRRLLENRVAAVMSGRPDDPITETGVLREFKNHAYRTRFGQHRADLKHQPLDLDSLGDPVSCDCRRPVCRGERGRRKWPQARKPSHWSRPRR